MELAMEKIHPRSGLDLGSLEKSYRRSLCDLTIGVTASSLEGPGIEFIWGGCREERV